MNGHAFAGRHRFLLLLEGCHFGMLEKKQPHQLCFSYCHLEQFHMLYKVFHNIPICRIWNWIHIHSSREWLYCFEASTNFSKDNNCLKSYFKHVPSLVFIWSCTLLGCIEGSFPVTNITKNCNFVCKTHTSFLITCKIKCWLMIFWT